MLRAFATTGKIVTAGATVAAALVGMMPGKLNAGEQDFLDRCGGSRCVKRPAGTAGVAHATGQDMVRVRKMEWSSTVQAYTFATEEENPVTIIWTPDHTGVNVPNRDCKDENA